METSSAPASPSTMPDGAPAAEGPAPLSGYALIGAIIAPALLAACGGGGGGGGGSPAAVTGPANTFTSLTINATAVSTTSLKVNSVAATAAGAVYSAAFQLGGVSDSGGSLRKRDPGANQVGNEYGFIATPSDTGVAGADAWVLVTINETPATLLDLGSLHVRRIRLFHSRVGMGASLSDLTRFLNSTYAGMIDTLLAEARSAPVQPPPAWSTAPLALDNDTRGARIDDLRVWWFQEMLLTSSPLTERMVLFWHNHFVTAIYDIFQPEVTWKYVQTLRTHAMGDFKAFVEAICIDPAMVMFLDNSSNKKGRPNENFARELMELFTLGEGQVYTEADIVQVARCFTGYGLNNTDKTFLFKSTDHDNGAAGYGVITRFLDPAAALPTPPGGNFHRYGAPGPGVPAGATVIDLIFTLDDPGHPGYRRVAIYIAEKLWDEFIGGTRDTATLRAIAGAFQVGWAITAALKALFTSAAFTDTAREGYLIRSPIELFVGMYRSLETLPANRTQYSQLTWMGDGADQQLGQPPNVRGWLGGTTWISTKNYMNRRSTLVDWKFYELYNRVPTYLAPVLQTLLLPIPPVVETVNPANPINAWQSSGPSLSPLRACFRDPTIHLK